MVLVATRPAATTADPNFVKLERGLTAVPRYSSLNNSFARDAVARAKAKARVVAKVDNTPASSARAVVPEKAKERAKPEVKEIIDPHNVFLAEQILAEFDRQPEKVFRSLLKKRAGYAERIQAQVVLTGEYEREPPAGRGPAPQAQPSGLYVLDARVFPCQFTSENAYAIMDKIFPWLFLLQDPSVPGPGGFKVAPKTYKAIPMMCESRLFKCDMETGRLPACELAIGFLMRRAAAVRGSGARKTAATASGGSGGTSGAGMPVSSLSEEESALAEMLTWNGGELLRKYPLPELPPTSACSAGGQAQGAVSGTSTPTFRLQIKWLLPHAFKGDMILYTGFHGNVSVVNRGVTCVQHVDYIPRRLMEKYVAEDYVAPKMTGTINANVNHAKSTSSEAGTLGARADGGLLSNTSSRASTFTHVRWKKGARPEPLRVGVATELVDRLMKRFRAKFEGNIIDVGSGSARAGEDGEKLFYEYEQYLREPDEEDENQQKSNVGNNVAGGRKMTKTSCGLVDGLKPAAIVEKSSGGEGGQQATSTHLPPLPVRVKSALGSATGATGLKNSSSERAPDLDSYFGTLRQQGYVVLPMSEVCALAKPKSATDTITFRNVVDTAVAQAERMFNFALLWNNVPLLPNVALPAEAEAKRPSGRAANTNANKLLPRGSAVEVDDKCSADPADPFLREFLKYYRFDKIRSCLDYKRKDVDHHFAPLSFATPEKARDERWHYLRSEDDRRYLCGDPKCWYVNRNGGPRFGNSLLSTGSGMGRVANLYRNPALLQLQAAVQPNLFQRTITPQKMTPPSGKVGRGVACVAAFFLAGIQTASAAVQVYHSVDEDTFRLHYVPKKGEVVQKPLLCEPGGGPASSSAVVPLVHPREDHTARSTGFLASRGVSKDCVEGILRYYFGLLCVGGGPQMELQTYMNDGAPKERSIKKPIDGENGLYAFVTPEPFLTVGGSEQVGTEGYMQQSAKSYFPDAEALCDVSITRHTVELRNASQKKKFVMHWWGKNDKNLRENRTGGLTRFVYRRPTPEAGNDVVGGFTTSWWIGKHGSADRIPVAVPEVGDRGGGEEFESLAKMRTKKVGEGLRLLDEGALQTQMAVMQIKG
eukprot:g2540.t1